MVCGLDAGATRQEIANAVAGLLCQSWRNICGAKVLVLNKRPLRCFRFQARGQVAAYCPSPTSRVGLCHKCGERGHYAAKSVNKRCCPVCKDTGRSGSYRCVLNGPD
ncbi:hypothetical protein M0802_010772 [Mischocyttarus mexicanus]|nr:hypothetical protein M0802_010772 [Mischocyttarus mexicanus]